MKYQFSTHSPVWSHILHTGIVIVLLPLASILFTACDCNGINDCNNSTVPSTAATPTSQSFQIQYQNLGTWTYWHDDSSYPQPPSDGVIVAYGDIQNDGTCHIKIFFNGDTVANLGHGTFQLVELTGGDSNAFLQYVKDTIQPPLQSANFACPII